MDDAQTWTLIGGFLATVVAMSGLLLRIVRAELGTVRAEMAGMGTGLRGDIERVGLELRGEMATLGTELRGEMATLGTELRGEMGTLGSELRGEIKTLGAKVDALDRDVQTLFNREFGTGPDQP